MENKTKWLLRVIKENKRNRGELVNYIHSEAQPMKVVQAIQLSGLAFDKEWQTMPIDEIEKEKHNILYVMDAI